MLCEPPKAYPSFRAAVWQPNTDVIMEYLGVNVHVKRKLNPQPLIVESDRRTLICWLCTVTANVGTALHMHGR